MTTAHTKEARVPIRTCVGCHERAPQASLFRVMCDATHVVLDTGNVPGQRPRGRGPGRGAYLHGDASCVRAAFKTGFRRSFRKMISCENHSQIREQMIQMTSEGSND